MKTLDPASVPLSEAFRARRFAAPGLAGALVIAALRQWPAIEMDVLAQGAARVASLFLGCPLIREEVGWTLESSRVASTVSAACSGADFLAIFAVVLAWRLTARGLNTARSLAITLTASVPLVIVINAVRIVAVTHAHRWVIPLFPASCSAFLHLATGVAVFLPALIFLHVLLPDPPASRANST